MKRLLSLATMLLMAVASFAYDFEVDGIYYQRIYSSSSPVVVTYKEQYKASYTGSVIIPSTIIDLS